MNTLQRILELDEETGEYGKPWMLRRVQQLFLMYDRDITQRAVADDLEVSAEAVSQYFKGILWRGEEREMYEDRVERSLEKLSKEKRFLPPRIVGTPEETYIEQAVIYPDLMSHG